MLVSAGLGGIGARGRATVPDRPEAEFERVGHKSNGGGFRRHRVSAPNTRTRHSQKCNHEDYRSTAWRRQCSDYSLVLKPGRGWSSEAVWSAAKRPQRRAAARSRGEGRGHTNDTYRSDAALLLDMHDVST